MTEESVDICSIVDMKTLLKTLRDRLSGDEYFSVEGDQIEYEHK